MVFAPALMAFPASALVFVLASPGPFAISDLQYLVVMVPAAPLLIGAGLVLGCIPGLLGACMLLELARRRPISIIDPLVVAFVICVGLTLAFAAVAPTHIWLALSIAAGASTLVVLILGRLAVFFDVVAPVPASPDSTPHTSDYVPSLPSE
jgi:hypothetical protein